MKTGIFGGTFDPVHIGHLRMAVEVRELFGLDKVVLVPCNWPPHKPGGPGASPAHRLEMVNLAVKGCPGLEVSDVELRKGGTSYTVDTLKVLDTPGQDLYFILGLDAFLEIHTWKDYENLLALVKFIVMARPDKGEHAQLFDVEQYIKKHLQGLLDPKPAGNCFTSQDQAREVHFAPTRAMDISATEIRKALALGRSIHYLVPEPVRTYIQQTRIYI